MLELATCAVFLAMSCLAWLAASALVRFRRDPLRERLVLTSGSESLASESLIGVRFVQSFADQLPQAPFDNGELNRDLRRAGFYKAGLRASFLGLRNFLFFAAMLVTGLIAVALGPERQDLVIRVMCGGLIVAAIGWGVPRVVLAVMARCRVRRIVRGLPDALDITIMCLRGGLALDKALLQVSREMVEPHPDLATELLIIKQHAEMNSIEFALREFAARIDCTETLALANLVTQNRRVGTAAADSLQEYVTDLRTNCRQSAEEHSGRAQLNLLLPVTLCLVPSLLILLWGPAAIELWKFCERLREPIQTTAGL